MEYKPDELGDLVLGGHFGGTACLPLMDTKQVSFQETKLNVHGFVKSGSCLPWSEISSAPYNGPEVVCL